MPPVPASAPSVAPSVGLAVGESVAPSDGLALSDELAVSDGSALVESSAVRNGGRFLPVAFLVGDAVAVGSAVSLGSSTPPPGDVDGVGAAEPVPLPLGLAAAVGAAVPTPLMATTRNRSCACRFTVSTRSRRLWPGISTTMYWLPSVVTSASETPEPLTRLSMMSAASRSDSAVTSLPVAARRIRVPPSRSSPSAGFHVPPSATSPYSTATEMKKIVRVRAGLRGATGHVSAPRWSCRGGRGASRARPGRRRGAPRPGGPSSPRHRGRPRRRRPERARR